MSTFTLQRKANATEMALRAVNIARRMLWGQHHQEIQKELGLSERQYNWTIEQGFFKETVLELQRKAYEDLDDRFKAKMGDAQELAREHSYEAMQKLVDLMEGQVAPGLQRDCANDIIKYSGQIAPEQRVAPPGMPQQQLNLILIALQEDRGGNGNS